ncbi:hypothetical protein [Legionella sp. WA2022007384]
MSTGKTEKEKPKLEETQTVSAPPPKPDVITPEVSEGPKPKPDKDEDKKAQPEESKPLQDTKKKPTESKEKNPYLELNEQLSEMVSDVNGSVNNAFKAAGGMALDAFSKTELGQALGGLKDALNEKAGEIKDQLLDKADEKLDDLKSTKAGQAALQFKDMVSSIQDAINSGLVDAIKGATAKLNGDGDEDVDELVENPDEEDEEQMEMGSPESSTSSDLMAEFNEAFEGMDFDSLIEKSPSPSPELTEEADASMSMKK